MTLCGFSEPGFLEDLRTARAAVAGGGFSLLSEAVSFKVPLLSVPVAHQYEQELNARYLEKLGYGAWAAPSSSSSPYNQFLDRCGYLPGHATKLSHRGTNSIPACLFVRRVIGARGTGARTGARFAWMPKRREDTQSTTDSPSCAE